MDEGAVVVTRSAPNGAADDEYAPPLDAHSEPIHTDAV
jgi:hypothetical protein